MRLAGARRGKLRPLAPLHPDRRRTGKVSFGPTASAGIAHRLTSRLLIVNPPETMAEAYGNKPPGWLKTRYYLWQGGRLVVLKHP